MRLVLASSSPARLRTLSRAGVEADVVRPEVNEDAFTAPSAGELTCILASAKGEAVAPSLDADADWVLVACDTLLDLDQRTWGKPGDAASAEALWRRLRGRTARVHTGHHIVVNTAGDRRAVTRLATAEVTFADLSDEEIAAYVETGEPARCAGGFTIDGFGGPFVTSIRGDHHTVVGISLPLLRQVLLDLGIGWHELWQAPTQA
ncbi:Maf family protein [Luteococcus sediminum]